MLVTGANKFRTIYTGEVYRLDDESWKVISKWKLPSGRRMLFDVLMVDNDGEPVFKDTVCWRGGLGCVYGVCNFTMAVIHPWMQLNLQGVGGSAMLAGYEWKEFRLPADALPEIKDMKIELAQ